MLLHSPGTASQRRDSDRDALGRDALASCLAASSRDVHVRSFGRFYEITYLVEKTSDLTLPDCVRCHFRVSIGHAKSPHRLLVTQIYTLPPSILRLAGPFGLSMPSPGTGESEARL